MMARVIGFLLFLGLLSYLQIRSLLAKGQKKEAAVYSGLIGIAAIIGSLLIAGIDLPSPTVPLRMVFEPIGKMILQK